MSTLPPAAPAAAPSAAPAAGLAGLVPKVRRPSQAAPPPDAGVDPRDINDVSLRTLMAANLHLGHNTALWNPSMLPYIYGERHGTHIINLEHTLAHLRRAAAFVRQTALAGGNVVFLGTKLSIHKIVVDAAVAGDAFFITSWVGGTITNKERVLRFSSGFDPSKVLQAANAMPSEPSDTGKDNAGDMNADSAAAAAAPASGSGLARKQPYVHTPDVLIVLDYVNNLWAVREANVARVPVVAVCDTNTDPTFVQYPIPANDDSIAGIKLLAGVLSAASRDGARQRIHELNRKASSSSTNLRWTLPPL
nr:37S ribosomal protein, mitochondrial [Polyrhizophydium stewartii]